MAIVSKADILTYLGLEDADTYDYGTQNPAVVAEAIHIGVEKWVQSYCNRNFELQSYRERYDGTGTQTLVLRQYPITAITRLSLWPVDVIRVKNTNTSTNATLSCSTTAVILNHDGVTTTLPFTSYTTYGAMVTAINAVGDGWSAMLVSPTFNTFKSTELIERYGLYCLENTWAYLQMPYQRGEIDFITDAQNGIIKLFRYYIADFDDREIAGFPVGTRNIFVDYTAGYTQDNMPEDLKLAVKILVKYIVQRKDEENFGATTFHAGEIGASFEKNIPFEVIMLLAQYRRKMISGL